MKSIKIISNPYEKSIAFFDLEETGVWKPITEGDNILSDLVSTRMKESFFPFRAADVVDSIVREYYTGKEPVQILFEGTADEFDVLDQIVQKDEYRNKAVLVRSGRTLMNARDIRPDISAIFTEVEGIVHQIMLSSPDTSDDLERLKDIVNDSIPLIVVGNYSSGKSSFINALIGKEILPSGAEPLTANNYRIEDSEDIASVSFAYEEEGLREEIHFEISEDGILCQPQNEKIRPVIEMLTRKLQKIPQAGQAQILYHLLVSLNDCLRKGLIPPFSSLVSLKVPFGPGILADSSESFVIFDTPGSNTSSNASHLQVLKEALSGMSNGLILYLAHGDTLDSNDNEELFQTIASFEEIDRRFALIVANKADIIELPEQDEMEEKRDEYLNTSVGRNLYSEGIFFVSSLLGLGAKNDGEYYNSHSKETYVTAVQKFINSRDPYYKQLYQWNITPFAPVSFEEPVNEKQLLYLNSGLWHVEQEILLFASRYAVYNKCLQTKHYLERVIEKANEETEVRIQEMNEKIQKEKEKFDEICNILSIKLEECAEQQLSQGSAESECLRFAVLDKYSISDNQESEVMKSLNSHYEKLLNDADTEGEIQLLREQMASGSKKIHTKSDALQNLKNWELDKLAANVREKFEGMADYAVGWAKPTFTMGDIKKEVLKILAQEMTEFCEENAFKACKEFSEEDKQFWTGQISKTKDEFTRLITGDSFLNNDQKQSLNSVIDTFESKPIQYINVSEIKDVDLQIRFKFLKWELVNEFKPDKAIDTYKKTLKKGYTSVSTKRQTEYERLYDEQVHKLIIEIKKEMAQLNPDLSAIQAELDRIASEIAVLKSCRKRLGELDFEIQRKMSWMSL